MTPSFWDKCKAMSEEIRTRSGHSPFCEGHVQCPNTGKEECGRVIVWKCGPDGETPATVYCFGCGELHNVKEE